MKLTRHLALIIILFSCLAGIPALAQSGFSFQTKLPALLSGLGVLNMQFDKYDHLWASNLRGMAMYDGSKWTVFDTNNISPARPALYIAPDMSSGDVWFCRPGLYRYDGKNWYAYTTANSGLPMDDVNNISFANKTLWVATNKGLTKYDGSTWITYNTSNSILPNDSIMSVKADHHGGVWAGFRQGLAHMDAGGTWQVYYNTGSLLGVDAQGAPWTFMSNPSPYVNQPKVFRLLNGKISPLNDGFSPCSIDMGAALVNPFNMNSDTAGYFWINFPPYLVHNTGSELESFNYYGDKAYFPWNSQQRSVYGLAVDSKGKLWFNSYSSNASQSTFLRDTGIFSFDPAKYDAAKVTPSEFGGWFANLDINKVAARNITASGDMFWSLREYGVSSHISGYEAPKGSCHLATFANALWIGGLANNNLHLAAMTYRQTGVDFWPGPLDTTTAKGDTSQISKWMQPWKINRSTIEEFRKMYASGAVKAGIYTVPKEILDWPAQGDPFRHQSQRLAPYVDVNHDGKYDPMDGDYPDIPGDQAVFSVFNDNTGIHTESKGDAMGIEVHSMAYAFNCDSIPDNDSAQALNYTTFYRYLIINRSNLNYDSVFVGVWNSAQLGNLFNDAFGSNPKENYFYIYNRDNDDGGGQGYGKNPPMMSWVFLHSPALDTAHSAALPLMNQFMFYNNDFSIQGNPSRAQDYYNYLSSHWKNGSPLTYGGNGYGGDTPTRFALVSDPYQSGSGVWNYNNSGLGPGINGEIGSAGPFRLKAGQAVTLEYAIVYSRDEMHPNGSATSLRKNESYINSIKNWYYNHSFPQCGNASSSWTPQPAPAHLLVYPVPAGDALYTNYHPVQASCAYCIINAQGQLVGSGHYQRGQGIALQGLPAGLYILRIQDGNQVLNTSFDKQ